MALGPIHPDLSKIYSLFGIVCLCLTGCTTPRLADQIDWVECDEPQREWPTRQWGLAHVVDGFPIYDVDQFPPDPYEVRGIIHVASTAPARDSGFNKEKLVVQRARQEGGQAALTAKTSHAVGKLGLEETDYLVIEFKTNSLASVLERINIYLSLTPEQSKSAADDRPDELAAHRQELESLKQAILARTERHPSLTNAPSTNSNGLR
jgi:hypothetical protein